MSFGFHGAFFPDDDDDDDIRHGHHDQGNKVQGNKKKIDVGLNNSMEESNSFGEE